MSELQSPASGDLTSSNYWDRHWDAAGSGDWFRALRAALTGLGGRKENLYDVLAARLTEAAQDDPSRSPRVLEVGCAPGRILDEVMHRQPAADYHGVDFSHEGVLDTASRFQERAASPTVYQADVRAFRPDLEFDFVYSCGLIEHFTDPIPMLQEHMRLCREGGTVVVTVPNYAGPLQGWCMRRLDPEGWASHNISIMNPASLIDVARRAGLQNVRSGRFGRSMLRTTCSVPSTGNRILQRTAKMLNIARRLAPTAVVGPLMYWLSGTVPASRSERAAA